MQPNDETPVKYFVLDVSYKATQKIVVVADTVDEATGYAKSVVPDYVTDFTVVNAEEKNEDQLREMLEAQMGEAEKPTLQ